MPRTDRPVLVDVTRQELPAVCLNDRLVVNGCVQILEVGRHLIEIQADGGYRAGIIGGWLPQT